MSQVQHTCPITGGRLIYDGCDQHVMDPTHHYHSEDEPHIKLHRHPFSWSIFWTDDERHFEMLPGKQWRRLRHVKRTGQLVPWKWSKKQVRRHIKQYEIQRKKERKIRKYIFDIEVKPMQMFAQTYKGELLKVEPMSPPIMPAHYLDFKYESNCPMCDAGIDKKIHSFEIKDEDKYAEMIALHEAMQNILANEASLKIPKKKHGRDD